MTVGFGAARVVVLLFGAIVVRLTRRVLRSRAS